MSKPYSVFANYYDYLMTNVDYDAWTERIVNQIKRYHPQGKNLVDLACGTGNISNRLAKKGFAVTGIDISEEMLMIAQDKAHEKHLRIQYLKQDMVRFAVHKKADVLTCICDGLNYITEPEKLRGFFENAAGQLNESGIMVLDVSTPYKYEYILAEQTIAELDEQVSFIWDNHFDTNTQILDFDIAFFVPDENTGLYRRLLEHHRQKSHDIKAIKEALEGIFTVSAWLDGETTEEITDCSERWLIVLKKVI